jgi:hypothetical protein
MDRLLQTHLIILVVFISAMITNYRLAKGWNKEVARPDGYFAVIGMCIVGYTILAGVILYGLVNAITK